MSDFLKKFIASHRDEMDDEYPPDKVWQAIEKKLPSSQPLIIRRLKSPLIKVAAAVILLIGISFLFYLKNAKTAAANSAYSSQLNDAEQYYSRKINRELAVLKNIPGNEINLSPGTLQKLKVKNNTYYQLQRELQANPGNERIQAAMIEYYRKKLEVIKKIQSTYYDMKDRP